MSDEWTALVRRYADGRPICNCGGAYYSLTGTAIVAGSGKVLENYPECRWGCQANLHFAKDEIAKRVLAELPSASPTPSDTPPSQVSGQ